MNMQYDLIVRNVNIYNPFLRTFEKKEAAIRNGKFVHIAARICDSAKAVLDGEGRWMIPGFVDIHMHIESSMSIPVRFSDAVMQHGTTTVVADPHEIANVSGEEGILFFLSQDTDLDIFYGIPSSVPSTNSTLETTGGVIGVVEVEDLLKNNRIRCLGEVMNFQGVVNEPDSLISQIIDTCQKIRPDLPLEGHCPKVTGADLSAFLARGISADHTHQTKESIMEKIPNGMFLEIQEKSMSQEVIDCLIDNNFFEYFCFVTDDVMADRLRIHHLNHLVAKAVSMGMKPEDAIYCATFTPARRMHLEDRGAIVPGRIADFLLLDDLSSFVPVMIYKNGKKIENKETPVPVIPEQFLHTLHCRKAVKEDFIIHCQGTKALVNIMSIEPHSTFTTRKKVLLPVQDGKLDYTGYALLTVFERYGKSNAIVHGLVENAMRNKGAIAASWAHDHHNVLVMGTDEEDMKLAQNKLLEIDGGFVTVENHVVTAICPLEIGGIVSSRPIESLGKDLEEVRSAMQRLGYVHDNEIMSFSTLSLLVSPEIKISDKGLVLTREQSIIPLVEEVQ